jgi:hypothetical protein
MNFKELKEFYEGYRTEKKAKSPAEVKGAKTVS